MSDTDPTAIYMQRVDAVMQNVRREILRSLADAPAQLRGAYYPDSALAIRHAAMSIRYIAEHCVPQNDLRTPDDEPWRNQP
jgi:hypothetical protein